MENNENRPDGQDQTSGSEQGARKDLTGGSPNGRPDGTAQKPPVIATGAGGSVPPNGGAQPSAAPKKKQGFWSWLLGLESGEPQEQRRPTYGQDNRGGVYGGTGTGYTYSPGGQRNERPQPGQRQDGTRLQPGHHPGHTFARPENGSGSGNAPNGGANQGPNQGGPGGPNAGGPNAGAGTQGGPNAGPNAGERPVFQREPDQPLRPHRNTARAELLIESPRVLVTPEAYKRMCLYVELGPKEVGWLGTVTRLPDGDFLIDRTYLVEQEVTSVETELSVEGREKLVLELLEKGDEGLEQANRLLFWGHSHVRMGTSPSGTDENTMAQFGREGHSFYIRGIFNKLGRGEFTIYLFDQGYRINDAPWAVYDPQQKRVIMEQPRGFGFGLRSTWRPATEPESGYRTIWGGRADQPGSSGYGNFNSPREQELPPALVIDEALRLSVEQEYRTKVKERIPVIGWLRRKDRDEQDANRTQGEGDAQTSPQERTDAPTIDGNEGAGAINPGKPSTDRPPVGSTTPGAKPAESSGGFWSWLKEIFSSDPTPPAPPRSNYQNRGGQPGSGNGGWQGQQSRRPEDERGQQFRRPQDAQSRGGNQPPVNDDDRH